MKSLVSIKSHPIHPILVSFPIAFYIGTLVFDILSVVNDNLEFAITGKYIHIASIVGALLAAVPGLLDFIFTVPPESSGKKRATKHGIINVLALVCFVVALVLKYKDEAMPTLVLALEAVGVGLTFVAGWLGGTLVYRNQIGVDNRYANAGKWQEQTLTGETGPWQLCKANELELNQMKLIHLKGKRIIVARTENGFVAFEDKCTHRGGSLAGGSMICGTVQCPWHGSQFDTKNGQPKCGPAKASIKTYTLKEADGKVFLMDV